MAQALAPVKGQGNPNKLFSLTASSWPCILPAVAIPAAEAETKPVTVPLPRKLWRRTRAKALSQGRPVHQLVAEALEQALRRPAGEGGR